MVAITKESVYRNMRRVFDWQYKNQKRMVKRRSGKMRFLKDTDWERGVFWSAVSTAWLTTQDPAYRDGLFNYTLHTGFRPGPSPRFADDQVCIQAYMDIYPEFNEPDLLDYSRASLDIMINDPRSGAVDWYWCDSLYMAPASFAAFSKITGETKYFNYAHKAYWEALDNLFDPETNLIYRDARYIPGRNPEPELREANGEKVFWSRGIGWVIASVPRILQHLDANDPRRQKYLELFKILAPEIIKYQHDDGFWRASFLDPKNFPNPESSATGLFCYALAWGLNEGLLDSKTYGIAVEKSWRALESAIHPDGMLGWVQLPAFNPRDVKFEDNIDYGAAVFLLAGTEVAKLYDK